ncbi:ABC transporter permease subunit [Lentzea sp. BCCO 10_0798]|uniref:ABC transporter permease subunit n=1 Tax=Lentzea kristufekii TaxID=3095430 RepID=A0ABU4TLM5_9PSEU|nr:ABC transporter permease subunit [Lentzea sp. BCCO 10_0798]MDX8049179.1 ABC transporter permease subunit [Lentzea sp. BCCO 10_0798]
MTLSIAGVAARPKTATPVQARKFKPPLRWISPVALVLLWQLASSTGVLSPDELASPLTVAQSAGEMIADGQLGEAFAVSITRVLFGFLIGGFAGVVLGLASGLSRWGETLLDPPVQMLRTLPHLGLIPLFILWFGIGEEPKLALVAAGVAFPLYLNLHAGIRQTDPGLVEAARVLGYSRFERVVHVVLPSAVPQTLVGLRIAFGTAWLSLISPRHGVDRVPAAASAAVAQGLAQHLSGPAQAGRPRGRPEGAGRSAADRPRRRVAADVVRR